MGDLWEEFRWLCAQAPERADTKLAAGWRRIPALLLAVLVGGSAASAFVSCLRRRARRATWVAAAGAILMGWIVGEVLILRPPHWSGIEILYFVLGALLLAGAVFQARRSS